MRQGQFLSEFWQVWIQNFPSLRLVAIPRFKCLVCPTFNLELEEKLSVKLSESSVCYVKYTHTHIYIYIYTRVCMGLSKKPWHFVSTNIIVDPLKHIYESFDFYEKETNIYIYVCVCVCVCIIIIKSICKHRFPRLFFDIRLFYPSLLACFLVYTLCLHRAALGMFL